jgi:hypothetical protein
MMGSIEAAYDELGDRIIVYWEPKIARVSTVKVQAAAVAFGHAVLDEAHLRWHSCKMKLEDCPEWARQAARLDALLAPAEGGQKEE